MFRDILDQDLAVNILRATVFSGRISHSYIFYGPEGTGKRTSAIAFAQTLNCTNQTISDKQHAISDLDACGECISCKKIKEGIHPDVEYIVPEGRQVKINQIRELRRRVNFKPVEARVKVYIIDDAGQITREAANSLLKTLEEPPDQVVLILVTSNINQLLPTIRSRCQPVCFHILSRKTISNILQEKYGKTSKLADEVSLFSSGSISQALDYFEEEDEISDLMEGLDMSNLWNISKNLDKRDLALKVLKGFLIKKQREFIDSPTEKTGKELEMILQTIDNISRNVNLRASLDNLFLSLK